MEVKEVSTDETPITIEEGKFRAKCCGTRCRRVIEKGKFIVTQGNLILCQMKLCFKCRVEQKIPIVYEHEANAHDARWRLESFGKNTDQVLVPREELSLES